MEKIGIVVFNSAILPKTGEVLDIYESPIAASPKRIGVNLGGVDSWAIVSDAILSQIPGIISGDELFDSRFDGKKNAKVQGTVVDIQEFENSAGRQNYAVILEVMPEVQKQTKTSTSNKTDDGVVSVKFKGSTMAYPKKEAVIKDIKAGNQLTGDFTVKVDGGKLVLYYNDDAMGESIELSETVKKQIKNIDASQKIPCSFSDYSVGIIKVDINEDAFKLDISNVFDNERKHANSVGVTDEEFDIYIDLMVNVYQMPPKLVKLIIQSWKPINNNYLERYISLDRIAVKDGKKIHPLYIDQFDNVRRSAAYLVTGKENICFKGEASVGKNILIETLAGLFRAPLLRESLSGGSDLGVLLGDRTVNNDNSIGFDASQLVKAAEDGCWIVLDEINTVQTEFLTVLHSLLESDVKAINVPFYKYVKANDGFRVLATMNPVDTGEYIGTKELNSATASRFKTLEIKSTVGFKEVLSNACPKAKKDEIDKVAKVYASIKKIYDARQGELSSSFLAIRRYTSILNDEVSNEFISLKERCIDSLVQANPNDRIQSEVVLQTINDIIVD